jgi:hypothetical protein
MWTYSTLHTQYGNVIFVRDYGYFIESYISDLIKTPWNIIDNKMFLDTSLREIMAFLTYALRDVAAIIKHNSINNSVSALEKCVFRQFYQTAIGCSETLSPQVVRNSTVYAIYIYIYSNIYIF